MIGLRSVAYYGLFTFVPLWEVANGHSKAYGNTLLSLVLLAGTVYLFGTIHVGRTDFYPLAPVIEASFKAADTLITEADLAHGTNLVHSDFHFETNAYCGRRI